MELNLEYPYGGLIDLFMAGPICCVLYFYFLEKKHTDKMSRCTDMLCNLCYGILKKERSRECLAAENILTNILHTLSHKLLVLNNSLLIAGFASTSSRNKNIISFIIMS